MKKKILVIIILLALIGCLGYFYMSQSQKTGTTPTSDTNTKDTNKEKKQKEEIKKQIVKDDNQEPAQVTKEKETTSSSTTPNVTVTQMKDGTYSSSTHSGLEVGQITSMTLVGDQYITIKGSFVEMSADGEEVKERFNDESRTFMFDDQVKFYFYGEKNVEMKKADFFKDAKTAPGIDFTITNNKITKMAFYS